MTSFGKFALVVCGIALGVALTVGTAFADPPGRRYIADPAGKAPISQAVLVNGTLYVAGALGLEKGGTVPADPKAEIKIALDHIKQTVEAAGLKMDDMVSVQIFCTDLTLFDTFNEIYKTYFHDHFPARAFLGTDKLLRGAHFEIMGIAVATRDK